MNKINMDTKIYNLNIIDDIYKIEVSNDLEFNIFVPKDRTSKICLFIENSKVKININLDSNSSLTINQLGVNASVNYSVNLFRYSNLKIVDSILSNVDSINTININHKESNSVCNFFTRGINLGNNKFYFQINGYINKNSENVILEENSRIINIGYGESKIIPNLIVDNDLVVANHSAFIGSFSENDIYYLNSRGISRELAKKLLIKSFLLGNMEPEFNKEIFIKILIENEIFLDNQEIKE